MVIAAVCVEFQFLRGADIDRERQRGDPVEPHSGSIRRHGKALGDVSAVDLDRVHAVPALVDIGALARVPDHAVVAAVAEHLVVAARAEEQVVARAAEEQVVARAAKEAVIAGAAEHLSGRHSAVCLVKGERVVAAEAEDADEVDVVDGRPGAADPHVAVVDVDRAAGVAAHGDPVVAVVADDCEDAAAVVHVRRDP